MYCVHLGSSKCLYGFVDRESFPVHLRRQHVQHHLPDFHGLARRHLQHKVSYDEYAEVQTEKLMDRTCTCDHARETQTDLFSNEQISSAKVY